MTAIELAPAQLSNAPENLALTQERTEWLHETLGTDYEHAQPFVDQFAYNPETGQDALRHLLSGDLRDAGNDMLIATGFHHEPSAGKETFVDRVHLQQEAVNSKTRKTYTERPFEPYRARTVIGGFNKMRTEIQPDGSVGVAPQESSMFPKEYDPLAVMKTIIFARDSRDIAKDRPSWGNTIATEGNWVMLDDKSMMRVILILDADTKKIITASPVVKSYMNLTPAMINTHLGLS